MKRGKIVKKKIVKKIVKSFFMQFIKIVIKILRLKFVPPFSQRRKNVK